jgi:hypothetical protein
MQKKNQLLGVHAQALISVKNNVGFDVFYLKKSFM